MLRFVLVLGIAGAVMSLAAGPSLAGEADVVGVTVFESGSRIYRFDVTVRHEDSGWEHYADRWEVLAPDGRVLATRTLVHPHENEQPFTRSLGGIRIAPDIARVSVRAHDNVHAYGGVVQTIDMATGQLTN